MASETSPRHWTRALLRQPLMWVAAGFVAAAIAILIAPSTTAPSAMVGISLAAGGAMLVISAGIGRDLIVTLFGVFSIAAGFAIFTEDRQYLDIVAIAVSVILGLAGVIGAVTLRKAGFATGISLASIIVGLGTGWLFQHYSRELMTLGFGTIGLAIGTITAIGTVFAVREGSGVVSLRMSWAAVGRHIVSRLDGNAAEPAESDAATVASSLFYDGPDMVTRLVRFFMLMGFSSVLASLGVITDSTAVVIGAMLVAPLMTPLMGISLALVSGWRRQMVRNCTVAATGIAIPIMIGVLMASVFGRGVDAETNTQILSRSDPTLLDLAIALAAGAAGAYALSRRDISDSLPGVAVAIALVPPLTVTGIAWQVGAQDSGTGAFLLFTTNFLAIVAMGALVFVATGIAGWVGSSTESVSNWAAGFAVAGVAVVALLVNNYAAQNEAGYLADSATEATHDWAEPLGYVTDEVIVSDHMVLVKLIGPEAPSDTDAATLAGSLQNIVGEIPIDIRTKIELQTVIE